MNCYQLSCGHWLSTLEQMDAGAPCPCRACGTTRTYVIGYSGPKLQQKAA